MRVESSGVNAESGSIVVCFSSDGLLPELCCMLAGFPSASGGFVLDSFMFCAVFTPGFLSWSKILTLFCKRF